ncbi:hypothetical protein ONS95_014596 [Cadophora gregata]|uniref:uncharacterized protein n=1 Tax=Cadophora gregata TaxID=51156 RepID=UPI0026DA7A79|nr:uncharacterized protein ONS95_014596 [Cadophora gregata]KAK0112874.1 hypothetical protein ONS95_014596 [Cadophora gregata]KAK0125002.1 hypothetical protein ONS96_008870 [Cadophora gregata f. sp. sojae]
MAWNATTTKSASRIFDITWLTSLNPAGRNTWSAFTIRYRDARVYTVTALRWRDTHPNNFPLRKLFEQRWDERMDPFWWSAIAYKSLESKRVVRSYAARKLRIAFTESLKKKGFAPDGNTLMGGEAGPLTGTAQLTPNETILKTRLSDLVIQTDAALEEVLRIREKGLKKKAAGFPNGNGKESRRSGQRKIRGHTPWTTNNRK